MAASALSLILTQALVLNAFAIHLPARAESSDASQDNGEGGMCKSDPKAQSDDKDDDGDESLDEGEDDEDSDETNADSLTRFSSEPQTDEQVSMDTSSPGAPGLPEAGDIGDGGGAAGSVGGTDGSGDDEIAGEGGGGGFRLERFSTMSDPINLRLADKGHVQVDYLSAGPAPLRWSRAYHSNQAVFAAATTQAMGVGWRSYYDRSIQVLAANQVRLHRANGVAIDFFWNGSNWSSSAPAGSLNSSGSGWTYINTRNGIESYSAAGKLVMMSQFGLTTSLVYDANGRLASVNNGFGRNLVFSYDAAGRLSRVGLPDGNALGYAYDSRNNLASVTFADGAVRQYVYENVSFPNALTGIIDESGRRRLSFGYDAAGRPNMGQFGNGTARVTASYAGSTVTTQDARGTQRVRVYGWSAGRPVLTRLQTSATADSPATAWNLSYDANGQLSSVQSRTGEVRTRTVDAGGRLLAATRAAGTAQALSVSHTWHPTFRIATQSTAGGLTKLRTVDALGRVVSVSQSGTDGSVRVLLQRSYNAQGLLASQTDARGVTTSFSYDAAANLASRTNTLGQTSYYSQHDGHGRPTRITRADGVVITRAFDTRGRVISRTVGGLTTLYAYDASGRLVQKVQPDGSWHTRSYDAAGLLASRTNHRGETLVIGRDVDGQPISTVSLGAGGAVAGLATRQLDSRGRVQAIVDSRGVRTVNSYGGDGRLASVTDGLGQVSSLTFDLMDRVSSVSSPNTTAARGAGGPAIVTATSTYAATSGGLAAQTDTRAIATSYAFDNFQRRVADISPDAGARTSAKSAAGDVISQTDSRGVTVSITRDALGRPVQLQSGATTLATLSYVPGRKDTLPAMVTDPIASTSWTYDGLGRLLTKSQVVAGVTRTLSVTRDSLGRVSQMVYPSGLVVAFTHDADHVASISVGGQTIVSSIQYLPNTAIPTRWNWGNGQAYVRSFDADGRMVSVTLGPTTRAYTYDSAGRITSYLDSGGAAPGATAINYDERGQITGFSSPQGSYGYAYDSNGNRLSYTADGYTRTNSFATGTNRILSSLNGVFSYDAVGNMVSDGYYNISYDALGRMVGFNSPSDYKVSRRFNAQGMRVAITASTYQRAGGVPSAVGTGAGKSSTTASAGIAANRPVLAPLHADSIKRLAAQVGTLATTQSVVGWVVVSDRQFFYADDGKLLGEYVRSGQGVNEETVWFAGQPVATVINGVLYLVSADNIGTPRSLQRASDGAEVWRWAGEAFGNSPPMPATITYNLRFPGQEYEPDTGYHYNWRRDYNPWAGRYLQADPIGLAGGLARYAYVGGNPVSYTDPDGLQPVPRGTYLPRGPAISGPPSMVENGGIGSTRALMNQFANMPNPAPQIPGGYVGVNFPWSMPNIGRVCTQCIPAGNSLPDSNNDGMQCRKPQPQQPNRPSVSAPGQAPACTCVQWSYFERP